MKMLRTTTLIAVTLLCSVGAIAQGSSTGAAKDYDSRRTTGIVDKNAPKVFDDVVMGSGLEKYSCVSGGTEKEYILEATACVVAVFDYDGDGKQDIYLLGGSKVEDYKAGKPAPRAALFRNLGNWKFEDVSAKAGLENNRWAMGVAVGDFDNDGDPDVFVSNFGVSRLYQNEGKGKFKDIAPAVGLDIKGWGTGASFGDFDKDGRLDLFVPTYVEFDVNDPPPSPVTTKRNGRGNNFCQFRGEPVMCGPRGLKGARDRLFRQTAEGKFMEVGKELGVTDDDKFYGFSSVFADIDDDRDLDILVVNDSTAKQLYINEKGKFEELGYPSGIALNENGREQAGMGLGVGDFNNDLRVDFHITNFSDDSNTLYQNDGDGNFTDITFQAGIGEASIPFLGWGTSFLDFDNDGWKDLFVANGHVYPVVDRFQWGTSYAQQPLLFRNGGIDKNKRVRFRQVGPAPGTALANSYNARGLAVADFDNDGRLDVVLNNMDGKPALLRNVAGSVGNWVRVKLEGAGKSPKDAVGAVLISKSGDLVQRFDLVSGAGYASQNEQIIHIGIGAAVKIDSLKIRWPDGSDSEMKDIKAKQTIVVSQKR